jgi:ABC-type transport system substrate-binding protein
MQDKTIRTVGASVLLLALVIAAVLQIGPGGDPSAISLTPDQFTTVFELDLVVGDEPEPDPTVPMTTAEPFVYRVGVLSGLATSNFWAFYGGDSSVWDAYILGPTKPALYTLNQADGTVKPELALGITLPTEGQNGWQTTVDLTHALSWSDGTPITAHDVAFTFQTVRSLSLGGSWAESYPPSVASVTALSDTQVRFIFSERPSLGGWPHGPGFAPIMPRHIWEPVVSDLDSAGLYALSGDGDVGGGALRLFAVEDDVITSIANDGYTLASAPDIVEYRVYATEADAVRALSSDEIDSVLAPKGLDPSHIELVTNDPAVAIEKSPANGVRYLGFNLNREPMSEKAFRTSLALLLDRSTLASSVSQANAAFSFISAANATWYDTVAASTNAGLYSGDLPQRLAEAVHALASAGYTWTSQPAVGADGGVVSGTGLRINGVPPSPLTILTPGDAYDPSRPEYAAEIAEALELLGFDVRPVETDFDTVVDLAFTPGDDGNLHYDMYLLGWTLGSPALPGYYRPLFATDGFMNNTGYASEQFAAQLAAYESSFTFEEARSALWSMEATLAADLPYLLLYTTEITEAYRLDRVMFEVASGLGGLQGRLGGITDVRPVG